MVMSKNKGGMVMVDVKEYYERIPVMEIIPNPLNPRTIFEGSEFDEMVASVREKEVVQPVLVRKIPQKKTKDVPYLPDGTVVKYEIVAGERRWRATCQAGTDNGGIEKILIPAIVRELDDEAAFDLMIIENFHRKDLTALEEARSFKSWIERKGDGAVSIMELSKKISIDHQYIRRRLAFLDLPESILKLWSKGKLKYGHLEQIIRLKTKKERLGLIKAIFQWDGEAISIGELKNHIDNQAPKLGDAKFNIEKAGCLSCAYNSQIQADSFGEGFGVDGTKKHPCCVSPACFKQKQNNYLTANWKKSGYRKQHKTNGFRFTEDVQHSEFHYYPSSKIHPDCKKCDKFITIIYLTGQVRNDQACIGPKECIEKIRESGSGKKTGKKSAAPPGIPRVAWHGEFFREEFYKDVLPKRIGAIHVPLKTEGENAGDLKMSQLVLFSLLKSNHEAAQSFAKKAGLSKKGYYYSTSYGKLFEHIKKMDIDQVAESLGACSREVIMQPQFGAVSRREVADHLGINLEKEWQVSVEYLNKKTISEMTDFCNKHEIFELQAAQTFLYEVLGKKRKQFKACKKSELIRVILESGIDLIGKVPAEILNRKN